MAQYLFFRLFYSFHNFFDLSITEETWVVELRIWCIKTVNALVLHFNPWVDASAGRQLVAEGLYSPVAKYFGTCFKIRTWSELSKKRVNIVNSSQNEGLSRSGIALSFDGFSSISWHSVWFSSDGSFRIHIFFSEFPTFSNWASLKGLE
jgi:hypothetical protein